jgi:phosphoribulokinase
MAPPAAAPVLLGVVGDSAAGKTTITGGIAGVLGADRVTVICSDDYHRYNRRQRAALDITALHPDCNYVDILEQHLRALARGEAILKPVYNHRTGDFEPPEYVVPKHFVIVEGLLGFHTAPLRDAFQVKVFLDPPETLRHAWKLKRDCTKRGYTEEAVRRELERREADSARFIRSQKRWADLVVRFEPPARPHDVERLDARVTLRPTLRHPNVQRLAACCPSPELVRVSELREGSRTAEQLHVDGRLTAAQAALVEDALWTQRPELHNLLPEQMGQFVDGLEPRRSHPLAITQLLIAYQLLLARLERDRVGRVPARGAALLQ